VRATANTTGDQRPFTAHQINLISPARAGGWGGMVATTDAKRPLPQTSSLEEEERRELTD